MTNHNLKKSGLKNAKEDIRIPFFKIGWEEARRGLPYNYKIADKASKMSLGMAYENARLMVLALKDNNKLVPKWKSDEVPPLIRKAIDVYIKIELDQRNAEIGRNYRPIGKKYWLPPV